MGYDMRWRKIDPSETAGVAAAADLRQAAFRERDALPKDERGTINVERFRENHDDQDHANWDGRSDRYARAQDAVMEASRESDAAEVSYFRLNMWGMSAFADVMYEIGMAFDDEPHPDWPKYEDYGVTQEQVEVIEYPDYDSGATLTDGQREATGRYLAEQQRVLAWHGKEVPGIPIGKFGSNDGWIVTPAECKGALAIYMAKLDEVGRDDMDNLLRNKIGERFGKWGQWLAYLNGAITHDGFEVH